MERYDPGLEGLGPKLRRPPSGSVCIFARGFRSIERIGEPTAGCCFSTVSLVADRFLHEDRHSSNRSLTTPEWPAVTSGHPRDAFGNPTAGVGATDTHQARPHRANMIKCFDAHHH